VASEQLFRFSLIGIIVVMFLISMVYRARARRTGGAIERSTEGLTLIVARVAFAALLYLPILAYMMHPPWMAWSSVSVPDWVRLSGIAIGLANLPLVFSVFKTIGSNISETIFTKETHALVTMGPYSRVRHPLYAVSSLGLVSFSLITANWFIAAMSIVAVAAVLVVIIPREEAQLVDRFGDEYIRYRSRSGRLIPRLRKPAG